MGVQGPLRVECRVVFPFGGGVVGAVGPVDDFEASTKERKVQARDKESGLPLWQVDVMDFDPDARERTFKVKVKVAAAVQPVPPETVGDLPIRPVMLECLSITPWIKAGGLRPKIAYSLRATGAGGAAAGRAGQDCLTWLPRTSCGSACT